MRYDYSAYWRTWNRRLLKTSKGVLEISLTPHDGNWDEILDYRIRFHSTPADPKDWGTNVLFDDIKLSMLKNLGPEPTRLLLEFNFVREIGIENLRDAIGGPLNNAGVPAFAWID